MAWAGLNLWHNFGARAQLKLGYAGQTSEMASVFASTDRSIALDGSKGRAWGARVGWKKVWQTKLRACAARPQTGQPPKARRWVPTSELQDGWAAAVRAEWSRLHEERTQP
ncbi:hypothetical protein [Hydrogenophaga palleronii]|uniref:hypothetical protein n=1 Tax=Hydrogenophaga palleronii TaxID=65655 RepID=UPI000825295C|nr:hypothetical protein [Hydrogenophaga palleronii]